MRDTYGSERVQWGELNRYRIGGIDLPGEGCTGTYGCYRVQRFVPADAAPDDDDTDVAARGSGLGRIVDLARRGVRSTTRWSDAGSGAAGDVRSGLSRIQGDSSRIPGDPRGAHVAGNLPDRGLVGFGDAWVLLVDFSTPVPTAWSLLAYGQTTDLASPHSRDQIELLASRRLRRVFFTEGGIQANLEREYPPPR
jgi:hypothetical protein